MRKKIVKKASKKVSSKVKVGEETFCFPAYGIVIKATSRKEAEQKLRSKLKI